MNRTPSTSALLVGAKAATWTERTLSILEQGGVAASVIAYAEDPCAGVEAADVAVVHVDAGANDPLLTVAALWDARPEIPVILSGSIDDATRAAALEAGVLFVLGESPTPEELLAVVGVAREQKRAGTPEVVRAMCRTMCALSSRIATASDASFLSATTKEIRDLFHAPIVSILLFETDDDDAALRVVAHTGLPANVRYARRGGITDRVLRTGEPRITLRRDVDARSGEQRDDISASMCIPIPGSIRSNGRPRGVLNIARTRARAVFTARDLDVAVAIAGLISDALTVHETKQRSTTLEHRIRAVERLSAIGELAAGIAHEVATPVAFVRANVDTIISYLTELTPTLAELRPAHPELAPILDDLPSVLTETWEGLARTEEVIQQMKALVRLNDRAQRDDAVHVATLVEAALRLMRPRLRASVETQLDPELMIRGSEVELCQALVNLLGNAADACEQRAREDPDYKASIRVVAREEKGHAVLRVEDNGVGIAEADLARVFMPLFTTKPERGTGLGLSIVRRIADEHAGSVHARSTLGSGTVFVMSLPSFSRRQQRLADKATVH